MQVLDWGCGRGQVAALLAERGLDVTPLDYREEIANDGFYRLELFPQLAAYLTSDPIKLPFATASFDAVLSCGVLEHVIDPDASLEEIRRVLRPDGAFYVYKLPNRYSYVERLSKLVGTYYHGKERNDRVYSKTSALELFHRHGFIVREIRRANIIPLNITGHVLRNHGVRTVWRVNRVLSALPFVNLFATNLELIATVPFHRDSSRSESVRPSRLK